MVQQISRRVHEAALLLTDDLGGDNGEACKEAARRAKRAQALGLNIEWEHWSDVAGYLLIIDSGIEFNIRD